MRPIFFFKSRTPILKIWIEQSMKYPHAKFADTVLLSNQSWDLARNSSWCWCGWFVVGVHIGEYQVHASVDVDPLNGAWSAVSHCSTQPADLDWESDDEHDFSDRCHLPGRHWRPYLLQHPVKLVQRCLRPSLKFSCSCLYRERFSHHCVNLYLICLFYIIC